MADRRLLFLNDDYIQALQSPGASVVILPLCSGETPPVIDHLDGIVVTGNERPLPKRVLDTVDYISLRDQNPERYDSDARWINLALARGIPILGICRGMQTLNDVLGGKLWRLPPLPDGRLHAQTAAPDQTWHTLRIVEDSLLVSVLGATTIPVNSFHVQGVRTPGEGVRFTAFAPGGVAEAIECPDLPFALGVQFHPEKLIATDPRMAGIFNTLVEAATNFRHSRHRGRPRAAGGST